jgi:hypothetical protein
MAKKLHGILPHFTKVDRSYRLNSPNQSEGGEREVLKAINGVIEEAGAPVTIKIGRWKFDNVIGANKAGGLAPKADITLVSYNNTGLQDVCWISHKQGQVARSFQQYCGISEQSDGRKRGSISQDESVIEFLRRIVPLADLIRAGERFYTVIKDNRLIGKAVYGPEFGSSKFGPDNIHLIGQGNAIMKPSGKNAYNLSFSPHIETDPEVAQFKSGGYTAVIGCRAGSGRSFSVDGKTHQGIRVFILPKDSLGGKAKEIKLD